MFKFLKNLFSWPSKANGLRLKNEAKYCIDHLNLTDKQLTKCLHLAVLSQVDISADRNDDGEHIFNVHVSSVQVAGLDQTTNAYINTVSPGILKATVATLCYGAGEYAMRDDTPLARAGREAESGPNAPPLPNKDTLLN
jgi:hypothetical protein